MSLEQLLERVETASGPDLKIDGHLAVLVGWEWHGDGSIDEHWEFAGHWVKPGFPTNGSFGKRGQGLCDCQTIRPEEGNDEDCPAYTSSIDAAVKLVEEKLPQAHWRIEKTCMRPALSFRTHQFTGYCGDWGTPCRAEGHTPALALLAALLRAMIAEGKS